MNRHAAPAALHAAICLLILLAALGWALHRGQDVNWDLQNYHQYDAYVLLHGRLDRDVAPAGPQSFLNPLPYIFPYALHRLLPPRPADLLQAASQSIALMLAWFIAWCLLPAALPGQRSQTHAWRAPLLPAIAATAAAITGPVVLSELGTSFADLTLAIPPLAGLLLLARTPSTRRSLPAGGLTGIAIGIKPTSLFLLPAVAAFAALRQQNAATAARAAALAALGCAAGALLSDGAWALFLWHRYDSPMFPFMNTLFRSHSAALFDFSDPRYHFIGLRHALQIPFALAAGSAATGEVPIRDARLAIALCLAVPCLAWRCIRHPSSADPLSGLCAYFLLGLAGWLVLCPIQRYGAVLEILAGLIGVLILARLPGRSAAATATIAASLLLIASTRPAEFFHRPWSDAYRAVVPAAIPPGATYGLLAQPLAYWITTPPRPAHAFGLSSTLLETGGVLQRRLETIIGSAGDRLWLLNLDELVGAEIRAEMQIHHIALAPPCLRAPSMVWIDTVFCRGIVTAPRRLAASDLRIGQTARFNGSGDGLIYEIDGFVATEPDGTWATDHTATLAIHLDSDTRTHGAMLSVRLAGVGGAPVHQVTITPDGGQPRIAALGPPTWFATPLVCIPPHAPDDGTVLIHFHTDDSRPLSELGKSAETRHLAFKLYDIALHPIGTSPCPLTAPRYAPPRPPA